MDIPSGQTTGHADLKEPGNSEISIDEIIVKLQPGQVSDPRKAWNLIQGMSRKMNIYKYIFTQM